MSQSTSRPSSPPPYTATGLSSSPVAPLPSNPTPVDIPTLCTLILSSFAFIQSRPLNTFNLVTHTSTLPSPSASPPSRRRLTLLVTRQRSHNATEYVARISEDFNSPTPADQGLETDEEIAAIERAHRRMYDLVKPLVGDRMGYAANRLAAGSSNAARRLRFEVVDGILRDVRDSGVRTGSDLEFQDSEEEEKLKVDVKEKGRGKGKEKGKVDKEQKGKGKGRSAVEVKIKDKEDGETAPVEVEKKGKLRWPWRGG